VNVVGRRSPARARRRARDRDALRPALALDDLADALRQVGDRRRVVLRGVGDAEAAAEVDLGQLDAVLVTDPRVQGDDPARRDLEAGRVVDLRADVECRPTSSSDGCERTWRTASAAWPPAIENPNFWSSCAVAMYSWVCASTPTVVRTITRCRTPWIAATAASRATSS
jgi:hypothetical protein